MEELTVKYKHILSIYHELIEKYEYRGIENIPSWEIKDYGYYLGKKELCEEILKDLMKQKITQKF